MISIAEKPQVQQEALSRAVKNTSLSNYPAIFQGFMDMGIDEADIKPRENVFTYNAWKALNRQVVKGAKGVRVCTFVKMDIKTDKAVQDITEQAKTKTFSRPRQTTVFHISQTKAV